ncbi:telomere-associated protein 1 [Astathelohania contejeani]|uniref:Telomere-associated protein 1 n=1 Tax=Astathelohania contejeani TaxID=164912 RepID=A0ABQ7HY66_9MICR|nr:telomere-associated protein 1 [Thelohania contejeani]
MENMISEDSDNIIYHLTEELGRDEDKDSPIKQRKHIKGVNVDYRKTRSNPTPWTAAEISDLKDGIKRHGIGKWKAILSDPKYKFAECRTSVSLKDKYRLLSRNTSYYQCKPKEFVFVDVDNEIIKDALGCYTIYKERYPYEAAVRMAKYYGLGNNGPEVFYLMDVNKPGCSHVYEAEMMDNVLKIKKKKELYIERT